MGGVYSSFTVVEDALSPTREDSHMKDSINGARPRIGAIVAAVVGTTLVFSGVLGGVSSRFDASSAFARGGGGPGGGGGGGKPPPPPKGGKPPPKKEGGGKPPPPGMGEPGMGEGGEKPPPPPKDGEGGDKPPPPPEGGMGDCPPPPPKDGEGGDRPPPPPPPPEDGDGDGGHKPPPPPLRRAMAKGATSRLRRLRLRLRLRRTATAVASPRLLPRGTAAAWVVDTASRRLRRLLVRRRRRHRRPRRPTTATRSSRPRGPRSSSRPMRRERRARGASSLQRGLRGHGLDRSGSGCIRPRRTPDAPTLADEPPADGSGEPALPAYAVRAIRSTAGPASRASCRSCESGQRDQRRRRADEGPQHVGLRVPDVALRAEEVVRARPEEHRRQPLDELVEGRHPEAAPRHDREQPPAPAQRRGPQQDLAQHDRGHEALREVPELVVGVAREVERVAHPVAERDAGVGPVPADHQDDGVDREEGAREHRQREAVAGRDDDRHGEEDRRDLHPPRRPIERSDVRGREADEDEREERARQTRSGASHRRIVPLAPFAMKGGARAGMLSTMSPARVLALVIASSLVACGESPRAPGGSAGDAASRRPGLEGRFRATSEHGTLRLDVREKDGVVSLTMNGQTIVGRVTQPGRAEGEEPGAGGGRFVIEQRGDGLAVRFTLRTPAGEQELPEFVAERIVAPTGSEARDPAVVGRWRHTTVEFDSVTDLNLELNDDGTCAAFVATASGRAPAESGTWKTEDGRLYLQLGGDGEWREKGRYATTDDVLLLTSPSGQKRPYARR